MTAAEKIALVEAYIDGYNRFDLEALLQPLHPDIHFEHVVDEVVVLQLDGLAAFRQQAQHNQALFEKRTQTLTIDRVDTEGLWASVAFEGVLAATAQQPKAQTLSVEGSTYFRFKAGKIVYLQDRQNTAPNQ